MSNIIGKPNAIVTDRCSAYRIPKKSVFGVKHIKVTNFKDDISNNLQPYWTL